MLFITNFILLNIYLQGAFTSDYIGHKSTGTTTSSLYSLHHFSCIKLQSASCNCWV